MKLIALALGLIINATAFGFAEDVAIDPQTGDTIIVQKNNNPTGKIIFLNDVDQSFKQEINLLPIESETARFEIEIIKSGEVVALAVVEDRYVVKKITKENGKWEIKSSPEMYGNNQIGNLSTLANGDLSFNSIQDNEEMIVIIDPQSFQKKDTIPARLVRLKALEIAPDLEVEGETSPVSIDRSSPVPSEGDEVDYRRSGMGFAAGAITGLGISYRRHLANKWGYQFTGIPWASSSSYFVSLGANFMRTLHATKKTRFMAIGGISTYLRGRHEIDWDSCDQDLWQAPGEDYVDPCAGVSEQWNNNNTINIGVGIGMEFSLGQNIGLAIELPVVLMIGDEFAIYPIPSVSLIYYF
jgi:hypothetical protein